MTLIRKDVSRLPDFMGSKLAVMTALWHSFVVLAEANSTIGLDLPLLDPRLEGGAMQDDTAWVPNITAHIVPSSHLKEHQTGRLGD